MKNSLFIRVISKELDDNERPFIKTLHLFYAHSASVVKSEKFSWLNDLVLDVVTPDGMERIVEPLGSCEEVLIEYI